MNVILKGEKSVMKLKRKLLAGLLTLCMAVGMAVPAFAANGPSSGDMSAAWVQLYDRKQRNRLRYENQKSVSQLTYFHNLE